MVPPWSSGRVSRGAPSQRIRIGLAGADAHRLQHVEHKDLAVTDAAGAGRVLQSFHDRRHQIVGNHHLDLHLRQEVHSVFGAPLDFRLPLLPPEALDLTNRQPLDSRSEEHTSELQSLMRISYAVFCLKKKKNTNNKE